MLYPLFHFSDRNRRVRFCHRKSHIYVVINLGVCILSCIGRHELMLGNTFIVQKGMQPPNKEVPPKVALLSWNSLPFQVNVEIIILFLFLF